MVCIGKHSMIAFIFLFNPLLEAMSNSRAGIVALLIIAVTEPSTVSTSAQ